MKGYISNLALLTTLLLSQTTNASKHYGFQSGFQFKDSSGAVDGNSYAGSLYYDKRHKLVYITGSTYWSYWDRAAQDIDDASKANYLRRPDCFMAILKVPESKLIFADRFGSSDVPEACSAISLMNNNGNTAGVITVGHTEEGGFLTSLRPLGSLKSKMYGFMLNLNFKFEMTDTRGGGDVLSAKRVSDGGMLFNDMKTQYPIALTSNPDPSRSEVFLVSLASTHDTNNDYTHVTSQPDMTAGGGIDEPDYGKDFNIVLHKIVKKANSEIEYEEKEIDLYNGKKDEGGVEITMKSDWSHIFSVNNPDFTSTTRSRSLLGDSSTPGHHPYVRVADIKYIPRATNQGIDDKLILVGTTNGDGYAFGGISGSGNPHPVHHGFITKLSTDGDIITSRKIPADMKDVSIKGICHDMSIKDNNPDIFVIGETNGHLDKSMEIHELSKGLNGRISKHAFLSKIDFDTLEVLWTRQLGSVDGNDVLGYSCAVSSVDQIVYMGGIVKSHDKLKVLSKDIDDTEGRIEIEAAGGDDIFVANYDSKTGNAIFIKQFGTSENDSIAKGNGIAIGENGDAIMLGNTKGSMMRWRGDGALSVSGDPSDVFVLSLSKQTGAMRSISEATQSSSGTDQDDYLSSPGGGQGGQGEGQGGGHEETPEEYELYAFEIVAITIASCLVFGTLLYVGYSRIDTSTGSRMKKGQEIMEYVDDFHDDHVRLHVRHSATGGIHGIYSPIQPPKKSVDQSSLSSTSRDLFGGDQVPETKKQVSFNDQQDVQSALESVEADVAFRNDRTMVNHIQKEKSSKVNSTPVFDGMNLGLAPLAPPSHAFAHGTGNDDDDDDDWETEIL